MSDEAVKAELLRLDTLLRRKQLWWEHPRNAALVAGVIAALAGVLGFKIGSMPPQQIVATVHFDQPLTVHLDQPTGH